MNGDVQGLNVDNTQGLWEMLEALGCSHIKEAEDSTGAKIQCTCPMHEDNNPSFMLRPEFPYAWNCFACGGGSGLVRLVKKSMHADGWSSGKVRNWIAQFVDLSEHNIRQTRLRVPNDQVVQRTVPEENVAAYELHKKKAYRYMTVERGVTLQGCKLFGIGYDVRRRRVTIPLRSKAGRLMGFVGRALFKARAKYSVYDRLNTEFVLFNQHRLTKKKPIVVVEGPIDCIRVYSSFGYTNVCALLKSKVSPWQMYQLASYGVPLIFFLDNDKAGAKGVWHAFDVIKEQYPDTVLKVPYYEDTDEEPGALSMTRRRFFSLLNSAGSPDAKKLEKYD